MSYNIQTPSGDEVFNRICEMYDDKNFNYDTDEERGLIICTIQGDDFPIKIYFSVDGDRDAVQLVSFLSFKVPEDRLQEVLYATAAVNDRLYNGSFDVNINECQISYRMTSCYVDSDPGKGLFDTMLGIAITTIDEYDDQFFGLCKGMIDLDKFIEKVNS